MTSFELITETPEDLADFLNDHMDCKTCPVRVADSDFYECERGKEKEGCYNSLHSWLTDDSEDEESEDEDTEND